MTNRALTVKTAAALSGISAHTLRAWERRYKAILPKRSETGRRIYSLGDVERLRMLGELIRNGYTISRVANLDAAKLKELLGASPRQTHSVSRGQIFASAEDNTHVRASGESALLLPPLQAHVDALVNLVHEFDLEQLGHALIRARMQFNVNHFVLDIISPLMQRVGLLVTEGRLSIAQEHMLSAVLRDHLGQVFQTLNRASRADAPRVVMSTPEGDFHEFGILLSAILSAGYGLRVQFLGPNLPPGELARAARDLGASLVVVGTTMLPPGELKLPLDEYFKQLDALMPPTAELWIGGTAYDAKLPPSLLHRRPRILPTLDSFARAVESLTPRP